MYDGEGLGPLDAPVPDAEVAAMKHSEELAVGYQCCCGLKFIGEASLGGNCSALIGWLYIRGEDGLDSLIDISFQRHMPCFDITCVLIASGIGLAVTIYLMNVTRFVD